MSTVATWVLHPSLHARKRAPGKDRARWTAGRCASRWPDVCPSPPPRCAPRGRRHPPVGVAGAVWGGGKGRSRGLLGMLLVVRLQNCSLAAHTRLDEQPSVVEAAHHRVDVRGAQVQAEAGGAVPHRLDFVLHTCMGRRRGRGRGGRARPKRAAVPTRGRGHASSAAPPMQRRGGGSRRAPSTTNSSTSATREMRAGGSCPFCR